MPIDTQTQQLIFTKPLTASDLPSPVPVTLADILVSDAGTIAVHPLLDAYINSLIEAGVGQRFAVQSVAPTDTSLIWVDPSTTPSTLKAFDDTAWVAATFNDIWPQPEDVEGVVRFNEMQSLTEDEKLQVRETINAAPKALTNFTELRAFTDSDVVVQLRDRLTVNDEGGGLFYSDGTTNHTASEDDDGVNIVGADGRLWVRQFDGWVNARWFGFRPNLGIATSDDRLDAFLDYLNNEAAPGLDATGYVPPGNYNVYRPHYRPPHVTIRGAGKFNTIFVYRSDKGPCWVGLGSDFAGTNAKPFHIGDMDYSLVGNYQPTIHEIDDVIDNGSGQCRILASAHGLTTGDVIWVSGVGSSEGANDLRRVTVIDADSFDVDADFTGPYTTDGDFWLTRGNLEIQDVVASPSNECRVTLTEPHGLETGDWVYIGIDRVVTPDFVNGAWQVNIVDPTTVDLIQSFHNGAVFIPDTHYMHTGTVGFLQASTQYWHKTRIDIGTSSRTFDVAAIIKSGRRHPNTGAIASGIYRGDTTLDVEQNCIYGGAGTYGVVHMGNGNASTGVNREGFANMHTYIGSYFTNIFGNAVTWQRGVLNNLIAPKFSASGGDGARIYADFNASAGMLVCENTKGTGIRFMPGSLGNYFPLVESGGSNRLDTVRDESGENQFSQVNGLSAERGLVLRGDISGRGRENSLKRSISEGLNYTTSDGRYSNLSSASTYTGFETALPAGSTSVIGAFEVPNNTELSIVRASVATETGGFVSGISVELEPFIADPLNTYVKSSSTLEIGSVESPLFRTTGAATENFRVILRNSSAAAQNIAGSLDIVWTSN